MPAPPCNERHRVFLLWEQACYVLFMFEKAGLIGCFCIFVFLCYCYYLDLLLLHGRRSLVNVPSLVSRMSLVLLEYLVTVSVTVSQAFSSLISLFPINFYPFFF
jgi:hypothetical protein